MITPLLLSAVFLARQAAPAPAASLISKMMDRYASANSLQGTIRSTQSAQNVSVTTLTSVAYERPSKIVVNQKQGGSSPKSVLLVSDGKQFMYSRPDRLLTASPFLGENVKQPGHEAQTVGQLYSVVAADLPDRSPVLDLLIGRVEDRRYLSAQFVRFSLVGKTKIGERAVQEIKGDWRESGANTSLTKSAIGEFELYIADDGELLRYVLRQNFGVPSPAGSGAPIQSVEVTNTWDATVALNAPISPDVFALRAR